MASIGFHSRILGPRFSAILERNCLDETFAEKSMASFLPLGKIRAPTITFSGAPVSKRMTGFAGAVFLVLAAVLWEQ